MNPIINEESVYQALVLKNENSEKKFMLQGYVFTFIYILGGEKLNFYDLKV